MNNPVYLKPGDNSNRQHGFTLVELLVAMVLGTSIITLLASTWWLVIRFDDHANQDKTLAVLEDHLRLERYINSACPDTLHSLTDQPCLELIVSSKESKLSMLVSPGALDLPEHLTHSCQLTLTTGPFPGLNMILTCPDVSSTVNDADPVFSECLLHAMGHLKIEIMDSQLQWIDQWPVKYDTGLPRAIRLRSTRKHTHSRPTDDYLIYPLTAANHALSR